MRSPLTTVKVLLGLNILLFLPQIFAPRVASILQDALPLYYPDNPYFGFWQFLTSMFMHGGVLHIFLNMFVLASFGPLLERLWGWRRFLEFYLLCGLGAGFVYTLVNWVQFQHLVGQLNAAGVSTTYIQNVLETGALSSGLFTPEMRVWFIDLFTLYASPMVGASGALYGVLVAFAFTYPNARLGILFIPVPVPAKYFIPGFVALDLFSGLTGISLLGGGIAYFAHVGGALIGLLLMLYWRRRQKTSAFWEQG